MHDDSFKGPPCKTTAKLDIMKKENWALTPLCLIIVIYLEQQYPAIWQETVPYKGSVPVQLSSCLMQQQIDKLPEYHT